MQYLLYFLGLAVFTSTLWMHETFALHPDVGYGSWFIILSGGVLVAIVLSLMGLCRSLLGKVTTEVLFAFVVLSALVLFIGCVMAYTAGTSGMASGGISTMYLGILLLGPVLVALPLWTLGATVFRHLNERLSVP